MNEGISEKDRASSLNRLQSDGDLPKKSTSMMSVVSLGSIVFYDENVSILAILN